MFKIATPTTVANAIKDSQDRILVLIGKCNMGYFREDTQFALRNTFNVESTYSKATCTLKTDTCVAYFKSSTDYSRYSGMQFSEVFVEDFSNYSMEFLQRISWLIRSQIKG